MSQPFRLIAAKGMQNGVFRLWYGEADNDRSAFVLTLTPQYVAHALSKALPLTLEEIEEFIASRGLTIKITKLAEAKEYRQSLNGRPDFKCIDLLGQHLRLGQRVIEESLAEGRVIADHHPQV